MGKTLIVAELSANHGHDLKIALETVRAAKVAGADAIKLQTYTPDTITIDSDRECFRIDKGTKWDGRTLYDLYKEAYTPWEWHSAIKNEAESLGLQCFSTPFDSTAVDFLESLNVPMYKVASFEITDIPLIEYVASKGKPVVLSTGIACLADIEAAVSACRRMGNDRITLLQCTSEYPADPAEANLLTMKNMAETFGVQVGLSDHTMGSTVALVAVALGASMIEKHFILSRNIGGPDASFSMEPEEFQNMVGAVRVAEKTLGRVDYSLTEKKKKSRYFARSLFVVEDMVAGEEFTNRNVRSIRPGLGLAPRFLPEIIGRTARRKIEKGSPLSWNDVG
jgi:pseudaminic acid synthase